MQEQTLTYSYKVTVKFKHDFRRPEYTIKKGMVSSGKKCFFRENNGSITCIYNLELNSTNKGAIFTSKKAPWDTDLIRLSYEEFTQHCTEIDEYQNL